MGAILTSQTFLCPPPPVGRVVFRQVFDHSHDEQEDLQHTVSQLEQTNSELNVAVDLSTVRPYTRHTLYPTHPTPYIPYLGTPSRSTRPM